MWTYLCKRVNTKLSNEAMSHLGEWVVNHKNICLLLVSLSSTLPINIAFCVRKDGKYLYHLICLHFALTAYAIGIKETEAVVQILPCKLCTLIFYSNCVQL